MAGGSPPLDGPTSSRSGWLGVFDPASGELLRELSPFTQPVRGIKVNPRTREIVTYGAYYKKTPGSPDTYGEVRVWDAHAQKELRQFPGHTNQVYGAAFDRDGRRLATASSAPGQRYDLPLPSSAEGVTTWDYERAAVLQTVVGHFTTKTIERPNKMPVEAGSRAVLDVVFSVGGKRLFSAGTEGAVKVWDADTLKPLATVAERPAWAEQLAVTPAGDRLLCLFSDGKLVGWDATTYKEVLTATVPPHPDKDHTGLGKILGYFQGAGLAVSPDGRTAAVATGQAVALVPLDKPGEPVVIPTTLVGPTCVAFSPDGRYLAIGFTDEVLGKKLGRVGKPRYVGGVEQWDLQAKAPRELKPAAAKP